MDHNELTKRIFALIEEARFDKTCVTCAHFDEQQESCAKNSNLRPPARIIVTGCAVYEPQIPF